MKHFFLLAWLFIAVSCGNSNSEADVNLQITPAHIAAGSDVSMQKITVKSSVPWESQKSGGNFTYSPSSGGAGQTDITVNISGNTSENEISGHITINAGKTSKQITVTQSKPLGFSIPSGSYELGANGGNVVLRSSTGKVYDVIIPAGTDWITDAASGNWMGLNITWNQTGEDRFAKVAFKERGSQNISETLIIQRGGNEAGRFLMLKELKIGDVPCYYGTQAGRKEFWLTVNMEVPMTSVTRKVEFKGVGVEYITFEGDDQTKVYSGDDYTFTQLGPSNRIRIKSYSSLTDETGAPRLNTTGLPIISIDAPDGIVNEPKRPCTIILIDPKGRTEDGLYYFESAAAIEYRGSGAQLYPKKPFSFELRDRQTNQDVEARILGLRNDQDWILDAMWLDKGKMRNRICFDIWNRFNRVPHLAQEPKAQTGTHGYLVEVFLNGTYHGLFALSDRLDRKQLKLKKDGGYLYKTRDWTDEAMLRGITSPYNNSNEDWNGVSIDYPTEAGKIEFKYLSNLINFVANSSTQTFSADFEKYIDIDCMTDYFIFVNLIMAYDNIGRNMYWGLYDAAQSTVMFPLVWDMDGTLGRTWNQLAENPDEGFLIYSRHHGRDFRLFKRIIEENPAGIHSRIKTRWNELRGNGILSPDTLNALVDYYASEQRLSGAQEREMALWSASNYQGVGGEAPYIKEWYARRLLKMDQLIRYSLR